MPTDTSESGLEALIVSGLLERRWLPGHGKDYDRTWCLDLAHLRAFVQDTQPKLYEALGLGGDSPATKPFTVYVTQSIERFEPVLGVKYLVFAVRASEEEERALGATDRRAFVVRQCGSGTREWSHVSNHEVKELGRGRSPARRR